MGVLNHCGEQQLENFEIAVVWYSRSHQGEPSPGILNSHDVDGPLGVRQMSIDLAEDFLSRPLDGGLRADCDLLAGRSVSSMTTFLGSTLLRQSRGSGPPQGSILSFLEGGEG